MTPTRSILATLVLAQTTLPAGMEPGVIQITLSAPGQADVVKTLVMPAAVATAPGAPAPAAAPAPSEVVFSGVAPGQYTVSACRLAMTGERISAPVTGTILVPAPAPAQIDVPASITLTLG